MRWAAGKAPKPSATQLAKHGQAKRSAKPRCRLRKFSEQRSHLCLIAGLPVSCRPDAVFGRPLTLSFVKQAVPPLPSYPLSSLARAGVLVRPLADAAGAATHPSGSAHRDAHYLLVPLTAGELHLTLDFEEFTWCRPALLLISPGQVHWLREGVAPQVVLLTVGTAKKNASPLFTDAARALL